MEIPVFQDPDGHYYYLDVVVNSYEAKNDNDLADTIVHRINEMLNEDDSVWGK